MRPLAVFLLLSCCLIALGACSRDETVNAPPGGDGPDSGEPQQPGTTYWWNDQVFYEVFVRSFYDADGDGIGDLQGLIQKLDYLNDGNPATDADLGVTALWLMPIVQSPSYHGYDATDYRTVESDYGTNADFQQLMSEAHARGIKVIVDYVMNHCSTQHPWFQASAADDPARADWFVWRPTNPGWTQPFGGDQVFHYNGLRGQYYYGVFWGGMPDLDYTNPAVSQEMLATADFWLTDMGADGFRLDAVKYLIEEDDELEDTASTFAFWGEFRRHLDAVAPEAYVVGEAWDATSVSARYVDAGLQTVFDFDLASALLRSADAGDPATLTGKLAEVVEAYPYHQYATFLTNHDQQRTLSRLGGSLGENRVAAAALLTLPGVPFLFYGEEVGMQSSGVHEDVRRPMQWTAGAQAGFTTGTPWQAVGDNYATNNVAVMAADENSLWHHYRRLVQARTASVALRRGTYLPLRCSAGQIFALLRHHEQQSVVALHNFRAGSVGGWRLSAAASQLPPGEYAATDLLGGEDLADLSVGEDGAIAAWTPTGTLLGYETLLIELTAR